MSSLRQQDKIVATIGPVSASREVMEAMLWAGMNVARLNFSHGDFSGQPARDREPARRRVGDGTSRGDHADLSGPEMRICPGQQLNRPRLESPGGRYLPPGAAMILVLGVWTYLRALLAGPTAVTLENVALRHQLAILQRSVPRPRIRRGDRVLWVCLSRLWTHWRPSLVIVRPATVLGWHPQGFKLYWRWKSRRGYPVVPRSMSRSAR
jgi:hypothetical protein